MKTSKKLMKAITTVADFKCNDINCIDCPFFQMVKDTDICLSCQMKVIQLALLTEQAEKR